MRTQSHFLSLSDKHTIHVEQAKGHGPVILCYSGFACSNYNYIPMVPYLKDHFRLFMIDHRGFGLSDPCQSQYPFERLVEDGLNAMDLLGIDEYLVAGISMGGFLAQSHALQSRKVKGLILIATKGTGPDYPVTGEVTKESFTRFTQLEQDKGNRLAIEAFVHPSFTNTPECEEIIKLRAKKNPVSLEQALMQLKSCQDFLNQPCQAHKISCPALIVHGEHDSFLIPQNAEILHQRMINSTLRIIPQTGHLTFFERPDQVAQTIISFAKEHSWI